jgi:hypothetical protein
MMATALAWVFAISLWLWLGIFAAGHLIAGWLA